MSSEGQTIRERVSHIARGCRAESSHNPTVYEVAIEDNLRALEARLAEAERALRAICQTNDSGTYIAVYREAGGGYEGLQAIARAALPSESGTP